MRKLVFLIICVGLFFWGVMVWLDDTSLSAEAMSVPVLAASDSDDSAVSHPQEYLVVFETRPNGSPLDAQVADMTAFFTPELLALQQQGRLKSFSPVPELGAILLEMPDGDVLARVSAWGGVQTVVPATTQQSQRVAGQLETVRQENNQAQEAMQMEAEFEAMRQRSHMNIESLPQPLVVNATFNVLNTTDAVDANPGDGVCETASGNGICTLRAAIQETNALPGADAITLAAGTYGIALSGSGEDAAATGDPDITDDLTISGDSLGATAVNGGGSYIGDRVFHVLTGTVTINYLDIRDGYADPGFGDLYGGGILVNVGTTLNLNYSTIRNSFAVNGGGILTFGDLSIVNSTFSNNSSEGGGTLNSQGYNLIQDVTGCTITGDATGNIIGLSPNLGPLQDNGGPTLTHALLTGSPAIDAGDNGNCPATDQRGVSCPADGDGDSAAVCDMGAYEYVYFVDLTSLYVNINETYLYGYVYGFTIPIYISSASMMSG